MASLDVSHDDMIDLLMGHSSVGMPSGHNLLQHQTPSQGSSRNPAHSHHQPQQQPYHHQRHVSSHYEPQSQLMHAPHQIHHSHLNPHQNQVIAHRGSQNQVNNHRGSQNQVDVHRGGQNQVNIHQGSQNQVSAHRRSQNHVNAQHGSQNLVSTQHSSHDQVNTQHGTENQVGTQNDSQNQVNPQHRTPNQVNPRLGSQTQVLTSLHPVHTTDNQISSQAQISSLNNLGSQSPPPITQTSVLPFQDQIPLENQMSSHVVPESALPSHKQMTPQDDMSLQQIPSEGEMASQNQVMLESETSSQNQTSDNEMDSQNQLVPENQDSPKQQEPIPDVKPQTLYNKYFCPGCKQSILYTNRSSLVQLLSLHQRKCPGTKEYRYMCLDCHSAFKTVIQLQQHEEVCKPESVNKNGVEEDVELKTRDQEKQVLKDSESCLDNIGNKCEDQDQDVKDNNGESGESKQESVSSNDDDGVNKVLVRETWTQTVAQPKPDPQELVKILLNEISPAGRKRRTCARKIRVYNEKELAHQAEEAELEMIKAISGRKSARACKKDLKRFDKGKKLNIKLDIDYKHPQVVKPEPEKVEIEPEKVKKVRKGKEPKEQELEVPLQCQLCPKSFKKYKVYTKHYQQHHEKAMCQYCGYQCIRRKLKQHEKTHSRTLKCPHPGCTRFLNSKHRLERHLRIHTGEKPFTCEICGKPFAGKENMVKHKKRVHDKERKYQCRYCGQKFADKGGLKYHENTHIKERPSDYRCKYCGRGYKSHVGCYLHERTHTGNTYKCSFCQKEFMAKVHLRKHEYIHTGNYPFRCGNCQKGFPNNGAMKKHKCMAVL